MKHDSLIKHVTGASDFIDDIREQENCAHAALVLSQAAHANFRFLNLEDIKARSDVLAILTAEDIPEGFDISAVHAGDEYVFAKNKTEYHGQALAAIIATTRESARKIAHEVQVEYEEIQPIITIEDAIAQGGARVCEPMKLSRGHRVGSSDFTLSGNYYIGGQEHFYLEGHIAYVAPIEDEFLVYSSTQNPTEVQDLVAKALNIPAHRVNVEVRRLGGGFGGKETQPASLAVICALAARHLSRPVKLRLDRDDDMVFSGKRHDFLWKHQVEFTKDGLIESVQATGYARCGYAADLSASVTDRALFHADNCYYYPHVELSSEPLKTHTVSNTAFRGFGGPQGVYLAERIIEDIAAQIEADPLDIRLKNLYGKRGNLTPYHQEVKDNIAEKLMLELARDCDYRARRAEILRENKDNARLKKGIALTPVKFGISFTATWLNQAGGIVNIYKDGSVQVNHGGIEMGQGLNAKMRDIVAHYFGISPDLILVTPTNTSKIPNSSATAASSGSDLNGKAIEDAALQILKRLRGHFGEETRFENGVLYTPQGQIPWKEAIYQAYMARISLFASGFYRTPDIHWDREKGRGEPFYYFAYGAACSEVVVDRLNGKYEIVRADILHDVGHSLNAEIDIGQIEGGFIQSIGWLTTEELVWDKSGALKTHAPSTYKIPLASDIPREFHTKIVDWSENYRPTIRRSKAVGEPPFCLGFSVFLAIEQAVRAVGDMKDATRLNAPATPEAVMMAMDKRDGGMRF